MSGKNNKPLEGNVEDFKVGGGFLNSKQYTL